MTLLIDARHIGAGMARGRRRANVRRVNAAKMLGIGRGDLRRIERGTMPVPEDLLKRICHYAYLMMCACDNKKLNRT